MSEAVQLYEGVKFSGDWVGAAAMQQVILWDVGPEKPTAPAKPKRPQGKDGDPDYELAKIELAEELEDYSAALKAHKKAKQEYDEWHKRNGGPVELPFWSCDANDALERDSRAVNEKRQSRRRYYISARTRGYAKAANRGLPEGMKPGHGQAEIERRSREGDAEMAAALRADPVFGVQELRQ